MNPPVKQQGSNPTPRIDSSDDIIIGNKRDKNHSNVIITNLRCSLTINPQIQVSDY